MGHPVRIELINIGLRIKFSNQCTKTKHNLDSGQGRKYEASSEDWTHFSVAMDLRDEVVNHYTTRKGPGRS